MELVWEDVEKAYRSFPHHYQQWMDDAALGFGLEPPDWYPLVGAVSFNPDPISVDRLRVRSPYSAPRYYRAPLLVLAKDGFLIETHLGGFFLTSSGKEAADAIMKAAYAGMQAAPLLAKSEMRRLAHSLGRLSQACLLYGAPISKWSIIYMRKLDQGPDSAYAVKIDQYVSDIFAFRDDAHLAAWRRHNVSAHAWDVLTAVWRETASTVDQVSESLERRQWKLEDTEAAVDELLTLGWLQTADKLRLTEEGREVRQEAEALTDDYFYSPWEYVADEDMQSLRLLLPALNDKLVAT